MAPAYQPPGCLSADNSTGEEATPSTEYEKDSSPVTYSCRYQRNVPSSGAARPDISPRKHMPLMTHLHDICRSGQLGTCNAKTKDKTADNELGDVVRGRKEDGADDNDDGSGSHSSATTPPVGDPSSGESANEATNVVHREDLWIVRRWSVGCVK